jgi:ABC-type amino acid transport substrate-binding protein
MNRIGALVCCVWVAAGAVSPVAVAQSRLADVNEKTITLLAGEPGWFPAAVAIAEALAHEQGLRVLPVQATGCIDAAADVLQLTQIDVALLSSDCVDYAEQQGLLPQASKKLAYVARVKPLPILLITGIDVPNLTALAGKRIATGPADSAAFASGEILLGGLGLPFVRVAKSGADAIALLKSGAADAVLLQGIDALDGSLDPQRFHVLGLTATETSTASHAPALVVAADLKGLLPGGGTLETVSTALVLAVFNWPVKSAKAKKIKLFSTTYMAQQALGNGAAQLSAEVPGWQRYDTSQKALEALTTDLPQQNTVSQQGDGP